MRDKNAKVPKHPKRYQVKDHQDDCNDNSNVGDDRVLKMTVIVMTTTMTTLVMTMVTTMLMTMIEEGTHLIENQVYGCGLSA